jgi:RNA-directed DNA polymerase
MTFRTLLIRRARLVLSKFFDEATVARESITNFYNSSQRGRLGKVKCPITLRLIRKWLRAPIMIDGKLHKRRKGVPQGSPLSPLLSNIMLDQLDKELKSKGLKFVRYADDFSIYCKSKAEAKRIGNEVHLFLRDKLKLPINKAKSGIRRPSSFELLGHAFVPTYKKGEKGKYQLVVKKSGWENLKRKLKAATKKTKPYSFELRLAKIKEIYRGWVNKTDWQVFMANSQL